MSAATPAHVYVAPCDLGMGLFALHDLPEGTELVQLAGPFLTLNQVRAKGPLAANALQVGVDRYLDLAAPGRFANHACRPNAGIRGDVHLVALRDLKAGEEIRFDYSTTIGDGWTMECRCGDDACRGLIAAYRLLPDSLQRAYALLGIVQRFLLEQLEA